MKEDRCINLSCTDGEAWESGPATKRAMAICYANCEGDCPKTRAKFRITELCFRIVKKQKK